MRAELASLELRIGHRFSDPELLRRALTHSSLANEIRNATGSPDGDNEQLEFLGDSILGFLVSDALVRRNPGSREGELSSVKAGLVSGSHLHGVARRLELGGYLELGRCEEITGGRDKKRLLVDALEAVIAAMYLDGGLEVARAFVATHVLDAPAFADDKTHVELRSPISNYKGALQELALSRGLPLPRYASILERGPEGSRTFTVEARVDKEHTGRADGRTKKIAAQRAARGVYERLLLEGKPTPEPAQTPAIEPHN